MENESGNLNQSLGMPGSEPKVVVGQKRVNVDDKESLEPGHKRVKMRDLESVLRSEAQAGRAGSSTVPQVVDSAPVELDLNSNVGVVGGDTSVHIEGSNKLLASGNHEMGCDDELVKSRGFGLDLNAEDPFYPYKNYEHLQSRDDSECGSSIGPPEEKDPMRKWNEMKQNGYLSTTYAAVQLPKPRGRKSKNDGMKKKIELAKKEQVDRFAKIAAPSGLLNGLNPGIINHVRNSKQVHAIIEALVRSKRSENHQMSTKQPSRRKGSMKEFNEKRDLDNVNSGFNLSQEKGSLNFWSQDRQTNVYPSFSKSMSMESELTGGDGDSCMDETRIFGRTTSRFNLGGEDDRLTLKLASAMAAASENNSSLSNEESANLTSVTSLSVKAANVASQWLELLHQDIKGRLAALRRSKKRVRAVIHTELPFLMSREFSSDQEKDAYTTKGSVSCADEKIADAHLTKWRALFNQMDKGLAEEERQLENWSNQVKGMQLHCEHGLLKYNGAHSLLSAASGNDCRLGTTDNSERDLAIRAAAASIYSTCNFLFSMDNTPCF